MNAYQQNYRNIYRSRTGMILGVCQGLSNRFDVSVKVIRIIAVLLLLFTGFWPVVIAYLIAAYFMKPEPIIPFETTDEPVSTSYPHNASSRAAVSHLRNKYDSLNRRITHMEDMVTDKEYSWDQRLNSE